MTPLLSQQLMHISPAALPQDLATLRARLVRRLRTEPPVQELLELWHKQVEEERLAAGEGRPSLPTEPARLKSREAMARSVTRALAGLSRRIAAERPGLERFGELLAQLKSPAPYIPEPCPYEPFEAHNEDNDPDYATLLQEGAKRALIKAERSFSYHESLAVRSMSILVGLMGVVIGIAGRLHTWAEPSTGDALTLLGVNLLLGSGVIQLHVHRKRRAAFQAHLKESATAEETSARKEIERRERARLNVFLESSRRRRESYEATDSERRANHERQEAQRIELLRRVITGQEVDSVLKALFPLPLAVACPTTWRIQPDGRLELQVALPVDLLLPPSVDGLRRLTRVAPTTMDKELEEQIVPLAAALAVRHLSEAFFHVPTLRTARVTVVRPMDTEGRDRAPLAHAEVDRRGLQTLQDNADPVELMRSLRSRLFFENSGGQPTPQAAAS